MRRKVLSTPLKSAGFLPFLGTIPPLLCPRSMLWDMLCFGPKMRRMGAPLIFDLLISNVLPLYGLIFLGFVVGRYTGLDVGPIATIMLYAVLPVVMFGATGTMAFDTAYLLPPLIIAGISVVSSLTAYIGAGLVWGQDDKRKNLLGLLGVSSNATYFGVPIALAIAGQEWLSVYMMMVLPLFILDSTLSYYYGARGHFDVRESLIRVARLPIVYGAVLGVLFRLAGLEWTPLMQDYWQRFTGTTIVLGMMMIGAALARMESFRFDWSFFGGVVLLRYLLWPALGVLSVSVDLLYFHLLPGMVHTFIVLICACPLAANTVAYAAKLNLHPALTACMVLITTLAALAFIPFMMWVKDAVTAFLLVGT